MFRRRGKLAAAAITILFALAIVAVLLVQKPPEPSARPTVIVQVVGRQCSWEFTVDDSSGTSVRSVGEVTTRVRSEVHLFITSADLVYSLHIAELSLKFDAIAGLVNEHTFVVDQVGDFTIRNVEFQPDCVGMVASMHVIP